jgi:hypothetical protein
MNSREEWYGITPRIDEDINAPLRCLTERATLVGSDRSKPSAVSNPSAHLVRAASELNSRYRVALRPVGANRLEASVQDPWTSWGLHTRQGS